MRVTANGEDVRVQTYDLLQWYGSQFALRIVPDGWTSKAGVVYRVTVTPSSGSAIVYDIEPVDCD